MYILLTVLHIFIALGLVTLVLLQRGQGSEIGSAFGSGASQTVFGSQGAANFLTRTTAVLAAFFFLNSLALAYLSTRSNDDSVMSGVTSPARSAAPIQSQPAAPLTGQGAPSQSTGAVPPAGKP
ncbi:MAG: preprotein translocase subunit SecG [Pseudomonadota bacterium]